MAGAEQRSVAARSWRDSCGRTATATATVQRATHPRAISTALGPRGPVGGNGREPRRPNGSDGVRNLLLAHCRLPPPGRSRLDGGRQEEHRDEEHCQLHCHVDLLACDHNKQAARKQASRKACGSAYDGFTPVAALLHHLTFGRRSVHHTAELDSQP
eukprot:scaffold655_cov69-Phaeocystis_antarctica.AAC.2